MTSSTETSTEVSLDSLIQSHGITMKAKWLGYTDGFGSGTMTRSWSCTFRFEGRRMTVKYHQGMGHLEDPVCADVLDCLINDAQSVDMGDTFETWCAEYGYDTDSRKAEKTYRACQLIAGKLSAFLGDAREKVFYAQRF